MTCIYAAAHRSITISIIISDFTVLSFQGLLKGKFYDWQDSNVALVGSDLDKQVKSKFLIVFIIIYII